MKRITCLATLLALSASALCSAADSQLTAVTSILGELRVGIASKSIPFSYTTEDSNGPIGHQVDLANQLAHDMGVEISFKSGEFDSLVEQLARGNIDVIMAATPMNVSVAKRAAFTRPWGRTGITPVTLGESVGSYRSWNDLLRTEVRVGVNEEGPITGFFQSIAPGKESQTIDNSSDAITALIDGEIDIYLTNTIEASVLTRIDDRLGVLFPDRVANRRPLASLVKIDDPIWLHYVNTWLTIKQETGYLSSLARKWGLIGQPVQGL